MEKIVSILLLICTTLYPATACSISSDEVPPVVSTSCVEEGRHNTLPPTADAEPNKEDIYRQLQEIALSFQKHRELYTGFVELVNLPNSEEEEFHIVLSRSSSAPTAEIWDKASSLCETTGIEYASILSNYNSWQYLLPNKCCVFRYDIQYTLNGEEATYCWLDLIYSPNWSSYANSRFSGETSPLYFSLEQNWGAVLNYAY